MHARMVIPTSSPVESPIAVGASFLAAVPSRARCVSSDSIIPESKRSRRSNGPFSHAFVDVQADAATFDASPESSSVASRTRGAQVPTPAATPQFRSFHAYEDAGGARQQAHARPHIGRTSSFPLATSRSLPQKVLVRAAEAAAGVVTAQSVEDVKIIEDTNRKPERRSGRRATESHVSFVPQVSTKESLVAGLVGASVLAIESIWGPAITTSGAPLPASDAAILPLRFFVTEVLRRSRTSCSTLQVALYYLHRGRREIREAVSRASADKQQHTATTYPSPPLSPIDAARRHQYEAVVDDDEENSPVLCGRRMFLAALIAASKFLQDRNYSNRAWAKISGLPIASINANERVFLGLMDFQLHVGAQEFAKWTERLAAIPSVEMVRTCANIGTQRTTVSSPTTPTLTDALAQSIGPSIDIPTTGCPADATALPRKSTVSTPQMPSPEDSGDEESIVRRHVRGLPRRPLSRTAMVVD